MSPCPSAWSQVGVWAPAPDQIDTSWNGPVENNRDPTLKCRMPLGTFSRPAKELKQPLRGFFGVLWPYLTKLQKYKNGIVSWCRGKEIAIKKHMTPAESGLTEFPSGFSSASDSHAGRCSSRYPATAGECLPLSISRWYLGFTGHVKSQGSMWYLPLRRVDSFPVTCVKINHNAAFVLFDTTAAPLGK